MPPLKTCTQKNLQCHRQEILSKLNSVKSAKSWARLQTNRQIVIRYGHDDLVWKQHQLKWDISWEVSSVALCNKRAVHWELKFALSDGCSRMSGGWLGSRNIPSPNNWLALQLLTDLDSMLWGSHSQYLASSPRTILNFLAEIVQQTPPVARSNQYPCSIVTSY